MRDGGAKVAVAVVDVDPLKLGALGDRRRAAGVGRERGVEDRPCREKSTIGTLDAGTSDLDGGVARQGLLERLLVNLKTGREPWEAVLVPLAPLLSLPIYRRAMRKTYTWKGRRYAR